MTSWSGSPTKWPARFATDEGENPSRRQPSDSGGDFPTRARKEDSASHRGERRSHTDCLLAEVADVLGRPRIQARWPLSSDEIQTYCQYLSTAGEEVKTRQLPPVISDPKDQAVVEAAVSGMAEVICTGDGHFYQSPAKEFLAAHGIAVMSDHTLARVLSA